MRRIHRLSRVQLAWLAPFSVLLLSGCVASSARQSQHAGAPEPNPSYSAAAEEGIEQLWEQIGARYPGAVRPEVDLIRYVSPQDWANAQVGCMVEQGFPDVSVLADGGIDGRVPTGQEEAYAVARYVCQLSFPIEPKYTAPLTETQLAALYDYNVDVLVPCLEAEGLSVSSPPSLTTFVDTYQSNPWSPYGESFSGQFSQDAYERVNIDCPQWPWEIFD